MILTHSNILSQVMNAFWNWFNNFQYNWDGGSFTMFNIWCTWCLLFVIFFFIFQIIFIFFNWANHELGFDV